MSERYYKLFSLSQNLYTQSSPIVISAGVLLKDNQTGKILAQIKLKNISQKTIKAVSVKIQPKDTTGLSLGEPIWHQYLDIQASRDDEFAQKSPVELPDSSSREFSVDVTQVIFSDNTIWEWDGTPAEGLPGATTLASKVADEELCKQYALEIGQNSDYLYSEVKDLWYCTCGALNHKEESTCHVCRKNLSINQNVDWEALKQKRDERLATEKISAEREREKTEKTRKKRTKLLAIILPILCVIAILFTITNKSKEKNYVEVKNAMSSSFQDAYTLAKKLPNGYKDSKEIKEILRTYYPYCGEYESPNGYLTFRSDFYYENGEVYWKYITVNHEYELYAGNVKMVFLKSPLQVKQHRVSEIQKEEIHIENYGYTLCMLKVDVDFIEDGEIKVAVSNNQSPTASESAPVWVELSSDTMHKKQ